MKNLPDRILGMRYYPLILYAGYAFLLGIVVYIIDYFPRVTIEEILKSWIPWNLKVNFFLILTAILVCYQDLFGVARRFKNKRGVLLIGLFLAAFAITTFAAPRTHRIFYDEDIYANIGQNIALKNQTGYCNYGTFEYGEYYPHWISYNKQPSGWPYLVSLAFQLFGTDEYYAFFLNNLLFSAGVLVVFFISWHLTGIYFSSFIAALAFAIIPHNLIWANTAASEPSASFFTGLGVLSLILYLKNRSDRYLYLMALLIPFGSQMRSESLLILLWVLIAFLLTSPGSLLNRRLWTFALLTTLFLLPHFLHFYAVSGHSWGAEGDKLSLRFFWNNFYTNGAYYFNNRYFPVVLTAFALLGLLFPRQFFKWRTLIFLWFVLFWGVFLFFYAGSYEYGADVRFSLLSFMPLSILAGMGGGFIGEKTSFSDIRYRNLGSCLVILIMIFGFLKFLPLVRQVGQEAWGARHDHEYAKEFIEEIPRRSIVLTQNPTMFLLWGQNAVQTYAGIRNPGLIEHLMKKYQGHVYFHYNYWCNVRSERNRRLCKAIEGKYLLKEIVTAYEQNYKYGLYQMSFK